MGALRQDARNVFEQAAAGDVREPLDRARLDRGEQRANIDSSRGHQRLDQQHVLIEQCRAIELPALVGGQAANQREAVGMDARRGQAQDHVAVADGRAGQHLVALDRADAEPRQIIIARGIHARHLGRLAADQGASGDTAPFGDRGDHALRHIAFQLGGRVVIQEKQRLGALHHEVVGAHGDQIDADAVMAVMLDRELQLGADAVIGRDQQRIGKTGGLQIEETTKAAQVRIRARPSRRLGERADRADQRVTGGDRNASIGIGVGRALFGGRGGGGRRAVVGHVCPLAISRLDFHVCFAKRPRCVCDCPPSWPVWPPLPGSA